LAGFLTRGIGFLLLVISAAKIGIIVEIEAQIRNKNAPNKNQTTASDENR